MGLVHLAGGLLQAASRAGVPVAQNRERIKGIVDEFRARLSMGHDVQVAVVDRNPLLVSVEPSSDRASYVLSLEQRFLETLDDTELRAVVAHELGHVWIFTHHPFLHTEPLANRIAMRLVTRESLVSVYEKVWKHGGTKGDLSRFLDD
jgi:hypothetical protein